MNDVTKKYYIDMESKPQSRWTIRKIIEGILVGFGMMLSLTAVTVLLDYIEDAEEYQTITQPVVEAVLNQSNVVNGELRFDSIPLTAKQRTDLSFDLSFFNFKNPNRSISGLKYQLWGGLILLTIGSLLAGQRTRKEQLEREVKTVEPHHIFPDDAPKIRRVTSVDSDSLVKQQFHGDQQHEQEEKGKSQA